VIQSKLSTELSVGLYRSGSWALSIASSGRFAYMTGGDIEKSFRVRREDGIIGWRG
jgi:hypothetical protein